MCRPIYIGFIFDKRSGIYFISIKYNRDLELINDDCLDNMGVHVTIFNCTA